ncbi:MAG: CPBP family intramembrane metalloprotease, partial [Proteobacteria bacterium]|nr:CPBP family intramembrane metalloprotease [Pseudomonadota bacterium]
MHSSPPLKHVVAVLVATVAALLLRASLQIRLLEEGYDPLLAADLSYLAVPPLLALLLFPVIAKDRRHIRASFRPSDLSLGIVLCAAGIGVLVRIVWHGSAVARAAFGAEPGAAAGDVVVRYDCPAVHLILLSLVVTSLMLPIVEELTHRGYVQSYLSRLGPVGAVAVSTAVFVVLHPRSSWPFAAFGGVVIGTCF